MYVILTPSEKEIHKYLFLPNPQIAISLWSFHFEYVGYLFRVLLKEYGHVCNASSIHGLLNGYSAWRGFALPLSWFYDPLTSDNKGSLQPWSRIQVEQYHLRMVWNKRTWFRHTFLEYETYSKVKDFEASPRRLDSVCSGRPCEPWRHIYKILLKPIWISYNVKFWDACLKNTF